MPTVVEGDFEWDADKAEANLAKHGVGFEEAKLVFNDPFALDIDDGSRAARILAIGVSGVGRLIAVVYELRGERVRIISARLATRQEWRFYDSGG